MNLSLCQTIFMPSSKFPAVGAYRIRPYRIRPYHMRPYHIHPTMAYATQRRAYATQRRAYATQQGAYAIRPYGHRPNHWGRLCGDSNPPYPKKSDFRCGNEIITNISSVILAVLKKSQNISVTILHVGTWIDSTTNNYKKDGRPPTRSSVLFQSENSRDAKYCVSTKGAA